MLNIRKASGQAIANRASISLAYALVILVIATGLIYLTSCSIVSPQEDAQSFSPPAGAANLPTTPYVELGLSPPSAPTPTPTLMPMTSFQNGVNYVTWTGDGFSSHESDLTLSQIIRPMGTDWVAIVVIEQEMRGQSENKENAYRYQVRIQLVIAVSLIKGLTDWFRLSNSLL